jgi:type I site-specific restriction-modification system R (restriction) subunit
VTNHEPHPCQPGAEERHAENATIWSAFQQFQTYQAESPALFPPNALLAVSGGMEARVGALGAGPRVVHHRIRRRSRPPPMGHGRAAWLEAALRLAGPQRRRDRGPGEPAAERDDYGEVVLAQRLRDALARLNPALPAEALEDAFRKLTRPEGADLIVRNRACTACWWTA